MSQPKEYSFMTKERLMTYTFIALLIITIVTIVMWSAENPIDPVTKAPLMNLGLTVAIMAVITTGIAVGLDFLISKVASDAQHNTMSAAVFGLIVTLSYSLGVPLMATGTDSTAIAALSPPLAFYLAAIMSALGLVVFKKIAGLAGRKYVNPAAVSNLIVLLPFVSTVLLAGDHFKSFTAGGLSVPLLAGPIGNTVIHNNGLASFTSYVQGCYQLSTATTSTNVYFLMLVEKFHGWAGGASSLAVIIVGLGLFIVARKYIKWRITLTYLVTVAILALILTAVYGGDDIRLLFELFIGSSIFLAFFMATDPATTPLTYTGQVIFGVGLGVLTVLIQTYMNFWGGSILALVIMNLTSPKLDSIGRLKPVEGGEEPKLPKAKKFTEVTTTPCIRCGACMRVCCNRLSPILIKQARDKQNIKQLMKLDADFCAGCGQCNYVCPARIDLKSNVLNYPMTEADEKSIEETFLRGNAEENIGVYTDMFSAKSTYEGQDGGAVTALLVSGMQKGLFDAAIVVRRTKGYKSEAFVAESADDIVKASGTKYIRVRVMSKLGELVAKGKRKIAIVGTPCEIRAARRIQQQLLMECPDLELTMIGLFCYEDFSYPILKREIKRLLNVDLDKAEKTQIKKGKFIIRIEGQELSVPVKELNAAVEKGCLSCPDFTSRFADISVGSVGSEDGRSTVIVRSELGAKLVENLDLGKGAVKKEEVAKLAAAKKKRATETTSA